MVYTRKITAKTRALVLYYRKESGFSNREIARKCHISPSSVARIWREDQQPVALRSKQLKGNKGRPRKVDARSVRKLIRCLKKSRKENLNVTVKTLVRESGLMLQMASRHTLSRRLNEKGYGFYQVCKKGLVTERDKILHMKYSRQMKRYMHQNKSFWKDEVAFYLDGVSFVFKHNLLNSEIAPKARVWRKMSEGLLVTGKGSKEFSGGKRLHVIVAIAYRKGVVLKVPYEKMNGNFFAEFIGKHFNTCFAKCGHKRTVDACFSWIMTHHKRVKQGEKQWKKSRLNFTRFQLDRLT
jgi:transposase